MFYIDRGAAAAMVDRMRAATRAENQAAGARLTAVSDLDLLILRHCGEQETWCSDTSSTITAEIAAGLQISRSWAESHLYYARAMRTRLPRVGELLCAGDISYPTFKTIVHRTELITDPDILARVDGTVAARARRWPAMNRGRLAGYVDRIVARADPDAVRQRRESQADREVSIFGNLNGLAELYGRLLVPDARILDARLDALAGTVCTADPRTRTQRRADALGALAAGADRLQCRCGQSNCPAAAVVPKQVVIHVVAEQASVDGTGSTPGALLGGAELIPAELIAELAEAARLLPLAPPGPDTPPEAGYVPSQALADFIRARDLTCRFPGCDEPAANCDLDHTQPHADGGATHASNCKCLCRRDHLLKTFWGWQDQQLPDGTVIWRSPTGQTYVTHPGSALLFPQLCTPTGELASPRPPVADRSDDRCGDRTAMMPTRRRTRAQNHAHYVAAQRSQNRRAHQARHAAREATGLTQQSADTNCDEPPPF